MRIRDDLVGLAEHVSNRTLVRLEGLTDEEFRWEPVPGAWTVHRMRDGRATIDNNHFPVGVAPITSIAWRIAHLIDVYGSNRNGVWLGAMPVEALSRDRSWQIRWTADESVAMLRGAIERFVDLLRSTTDDLLGRTVGAIGGPYADATRLAFVHHQIDEAIHHGAEVGILRDLWAARSYIAPEPVTVGDAADRGRWDVVESMVEDGCDVNATASGRTALHQAAANGDVEMVRFLVDHGADVSAKDPVWRATASAWALQFSRQDVADLLLHLEHPTEPTA
jgi:hypothetical protein